MALFIGNISQRDAIFAKNTAILLGRTHKSLRILFWKTIIRTGQTDKLSRRISQKLCVFCENVSFSGATVWAIMSHTIILFLTNILIVIAKTGFMNMRKKSLLISLCKTILHAYTGFWLIRDFLKRKIHYSGKYRVCLAY